MAVDLGQVVGRGIKSITVAGTTMTIVYTDNTSNVFDITNQFTVTDQVQNGNAQAITSNAVYNAVHSTFELKQTINNSGGGSVKVYSDGLYVLVTFLGDFNNIANNGDTTILDKITNSEYWPSSYITSEASTVRNHNVRVSISHGGSIYIINGNQSTTVTCRTQLMYPLRSRMPQEITN